MNVRHLLSWKTLFYDVLLPGLRRLGAERGDAVVAGLGWVANTVRPRRRRLLNGSLRRAREALDAHWPLSATRAALARNVGRFLARDYPLDGLSHTEVNARFSVQGFEHLQAALAGGRGVIVLGSHLGAHVAALHWLYRQDVPLRLLVQRPRHVSRELRRRFDRDDAPHPQRALFLRRAMPPVEAVERLLRARAVLRDGMALYLSGDIPWASCNTRPGRFLGQTRPFLSVWADLAALTRAPVVPVFCTHREGGRYALSFDVPWTVVPGAEGLAVARYLERLEAEIAAHPADAVAHLTWPCYGPSLEPAARPVPRPKSIVAAVAGSR